MNQTILTGRLTKDIQIQMTPNGKKYAYFTLAVNRDKQNADFINCVAWEKTAELLETYCKKGSKLLVEGRISTRNYENQQGVKVYVTEVVTNRVEFLESKGTATPAQEPAQEEDPFSNTPSLNITSDDLPFY